MLLRGSARFDNASSFMHCLCSATSLVSARHPARRSKLSSTPQNVRGALVIADNRDELVAWLRSHDACWPAVLWVESLPPDHGLDRAWAICTRSDWMLWLTKYLDIPDDVMRFIACDFARTVLHLVPRGEERPRLAIETAERFACCLGTLEELDELYVASMAARAACAASEAAAEAAAFAAATSRDSAKAWDAAWDVSRVAHVDIIRRRTAGLTIGRASTPAAASKSRTARYSPLATDLTASHA